MRMLLEVLITGKNADLKKKTFYQAIIYIPIVFQTPELFRPRTQQWSEIMQMVHIGPYPGVPTTMLLPMIDMDPSN
ncbi:hypothetical protein MAR_010672 [Mya arenaria]|uniref:Uncharacterized protein n=1 Tax=Mya arenaria TaxID=6604 RepID=A0ABY7FVU1_MYAAR|nr:hypothetical protein MAR_010672 [Mya arenaria]